MLEGLGCGGSGFRGILRRWSRFGSRVPGLGSRIPGFGIRFSGFEGSGTSDVGLGRVGDLRGDEQVPRRGQVSKRIPHLIWVCWGLNSFEEKSGEG